ncbi:MAG: hypothetical protein M3Z37_02985, partial [Candidatus Eremiobacteraeota bacterium]|nr:hypothetical protein [Candidatus Eremiobacteraeota bacterium]
RLLLDTAEAAADYLRFFTGAVQGEEGPFTIAESLAPLLERTIPGQDRPDPASLPAIEPVVMTLVPTTGTHMQASRWRARAIVHYGPALFRAQFEIESTGMVQMLDDEPVWDTRGRLRQPRFRGAMRGYFD